MTDKAPAGYELRSYFHPGYGACPNSLEPDSGTITLYVPLDKTDWTGVTCGACDQTLTPEGTVPTYRLG